MMKSIRALQEFAISKLRRVNKSANKLVSADSLVALGFCLSNEFTDMFETMVSLAKVERNWMKNRRNQGKIKVAAESTRLKCLPTLVPRFLWNIIVIIVIIIIVVVAAIVTKSVSFFLCYSSD
jgi:uncharacterized integral membrane protein